jgi:hypothetical protein
MQRGAEPERPRSSPLGRTRRRAVATAGAVIGRLCAVIASRPRSMLSPAGCTPAQVHVIGSSCVSTTAKSGMRQLPARLATDLQTDGTFRKPLRCARTGPRGSISVRTASADCPFAIRRSQHGPTLSLQVTRLNRSRSAAFNPAEVVLDHLLDACAFARVSAPSHHRCGRSLGMRGSAGPRCVRGLVHGDGHRV